MSDLNWVGGLEGFNLSVCDLDLTSRYGLAQTSPAGPAPPVPSTVLYNSSSISSMASCEKEVRSFRRAKSVLKLELRSTWMKVVVFPPKMLCKRYGVTDCCFVSSCHKLFCWARRRCHAFGGLLWHGVWSAIAKFRLRKMASFRIEP